MRRGRRHHHRRARRGHGEDQPDVRAVRRRRAGDVPRREARLRSEGPAQSGQDDPDAARCAEFGRMHVHGGQAAASRICRGSEPAKTSQEQIRRGRAAAARALRLRGGGTKDFYGNAPRGELLDTRGYAGIVAYEPTELVITARCGTPLAELEEVLAQARTRCSPSSRRTSAPARRSAAASRPGSPGPRRASAGAVRDFVLGAKILDGRGELLALRRPGDEERRRLRRVAPAGRLARHARPDRSKSRSRCCRGRAAELTLTLEMPQAKALESTEPLGRPAAADLGQRLARRRTRACGCRAPRARSRAAAEKLGGERMAADEAARFWTGIREQTDPFFAGDAPLWRLSLPSHAPRGRSAGRAADRMGRRAALAEVAAPTRRPCAPRRRARAAMRRCFAPADKPAGAFAPLPPVLARLHRDLKTALRPGRHPQSRPAVRRSSRP